MKKLFAIAAMAIACLTASAQQETGTWSLTPKIGMTVSNLVGGDMGFKTKVGLSSGFQFTYQASDIIGISCGLLYSMQGATIGTGDDKLKLNLEYVNIPILAKVYLFKGFAVNVGVQPSFKTSSKWRSNGGVIDEVDMPATMTSIGLSEFANIYDTNTFAFAIPMGVSYEFSNVVLDARYNLGFTNVFKDTEDMDRSKNSVFMFTVGYKIGL